jgi:2-dehydro-3-deoxyphosphogluconate aldolase/(4S)-4-hydroxy-2-oxoglutarate aldolase
MHPILKKIGEIGIVPVIALENGGQAAELGKCLETGGIPVAEVTFRTSAAVEAIKAMRAACPNVLVGAGTVINVERARAAVEAGAAFIVSPGFNPAVVDFCLERGMPILPGVNSPSQVELALEKGLEVLKFFPAEASGGIGMIDAMAGPFPDLTFVPTGGIDAANLGAYARHPKVHAIGGSWMVKSALIAEGRWDDIREACRQATLALHGFSFQHLGVNCSGPAEAKREAAFLGDLGFIPKEGNSSIFAGTPFELMKEAGRGERGHIALKVNNVERALAYLKIRGVEPIAGTEKSEKGRLKVVYIDREVSGFAIHLYRENP